MAIPDYETLLYPILNFLSDKNTKRTREIINYIINKYEISAEETKKTIPSGKTKLIDNRVGWACTYLRKAALIVSPQRGHNQITEDGLNVLSQGLKQIDSKFLKTLFKDEGDEPDSIEKAPENNLLHKTPEEIIGIHKEIIDQSLAKDLLGYVSKKVEPRQFEKFVVDLLVAMGYGGSVEDAEKVVGQSHDGGIDGMIKEDVLGLDTIYLQAKRWQNTVPLKEVRDFAGALQAQRSNKGVFITTSSFSPDAYKFVNSIASKIILIDGKQLARLMIKYNLGVSVKETVEIKEIDLDYFET